MTSYCINGACTDLVHAENELDDEILDQDINLDEQEKIDEYYTDFQDEMKDFANEYLDEDNFKDLSETYDKFIPQPEPWEDIEDPYQNDDWSKSSGNFKKNKHMKDDWRNNRYDYDENDGVVGLIVFVVYICCVCTCLTGACTGMIYSAIKMKQAYIRNIKDKSSIEAAHDAASERKDRIKGEMVARNSMMFQQQQYYVAQQ